MSQSRAERTPIETEKKEGPPSSGDGNNEELPDILFDEQSKKTALKAILAYEELDKPVMNKWTHPRIPNLVFHFMALKSDKFDEIQESCTEKSRVKNTSQITSEVDGNKLNHVLIEEACVDPNFKDVDFRRAVAQKSGHQAPEAVRVNEVIDALLLPGEMYQLGSAIMNNIGFTDDEVVVQALKGSSSAE